MPSLTGEGVWHPAADKLTGGYAIYTAQLRPAAGLPLAGVAWINATATRFDLYAGTSEPFGIWSKQGAVPVAAQPALMAAFNAGFRIYNYRTGWYAQGRTAVALQPGAASLVIFTNGSATVADWGRDAHLGPKVAAVRQNLTLLVDHAAPTPQVVEPGLWGAVFGGGAYTWRSGIGITAAGDLVYAAGAELDPALLAAVLVDAGAVRAMELDINPQWVSFATFSHPGPVGHGGLNGVALLPSMHYGPDHFLASSSRDFFTVSAR